jgi:effector-binding domain-containing protein
MTLSAIEIRVEPEQQTAVVRHRITMQEVDRIPGWLGVTYQAIQRAGLQPAGMPFLRTLTMDANGMEVEVGWPVAAPFTGDAEVQAGTLPGGPRAVVSYLGPYDGIAPAYEALQAWCAEHGHAIAGAPWETYVTDPHAEPDPAKWRTDVSFPVQA